MSRRIIILAAAEENTYHNQPPALIKTKTTSHALALNDIRLNPITPRCLIGLNYISPVKAGYSQYSTYEGTAWFSFHRAQRCASYAKAITGSCGTKQCPEETMTLVVSQSQRSG